jgi:hypothetical protein
MRPARPATASSAGTATRNAATAPGMNIVAIASRGPTAVDGVGVEPVVEEVAALPSEPAVDPADVGAIGGDGLSPLPAPPKPEPKESVRRGAWRGRGWVELGLDVTITPLGRGPDLRVVSLGAGVGLGIRLHRAIGLFTAMGTFVNAVERLRFAAGDGSIAVREDVGRIFVWDLAVVRAFVPTRGRVQPFVDVGGGVGIDRPPFGDRRRALGLLRAGLGLDIWLGPTTTLGVNATYRLLGAKHDVKHAIAFGGALGFHW